MSVHFVAHLFSALNVIHPFSNLVHYFLDLKIPAGCKILLHTDIFSVESLKP